MFVFSISPPLSSRRRTLALSPRSLACAGSQYLTGTFLVCTLHPHVYQKCFLSVAYSSLTPFVFAGNSSAGVQKKGQSQRLSSGAAAHSLLGALRGLRIASPSSPSSTPDPTKPGDQGTLQRTAPVAKPRVLGAGVANVKTLVTRCQPFMWPKYSDLCSADRSLGVGPLAVGPLCCKSQPTSEAMV